jgi:hypothetical protein
VAIDASPVLSKEDALSLLNDLVDYQQNIETAITLAEAEPEMPFGWGVEAGEVVA